MYYYFFAGNKTNQVLLESGAKMSDFSNDAIRNSLIAALATNYNLSTGNVSFYYVAETDSSITRLKAGDQWSLTWSAGAPSGEITGLSFAIEDAKKWLQFSTNKTEILADGKESFILSVKLLATNRVDVDTSFSGNINISLTTPDGPVKARFVFITGQSSKAFKYAKPGQFKIGQAKVSGYRMDNTISVDVLA